MRSLFTLRLKRPYPSRIRRRREFGPGHSARGYYVSVSTGHTLLLFLHHPGSLKNCVAEYRNPSSALHFLEEGQQKVRPLKSQCE